MVVVNTPSETSSRQAGFWSGVTKREGSVVDWLHNSIILVIACEVPAWIEDVRNSILGARAKQLPRERTRASERSRGRCCNRAEAERTRNATTTEHGRRAPPLALSGNHLGRCGARTEQPITGLLSGDVGRARRFGARGGRVGACGAGIERRVIDLLGRLPKPRGAGLFPACAPTAFWCCLPLVPPGRYGGGAGGSRG